MMRERFAAGGMTAAEQRERQLTVTAASGDLLFTTKDGQLIPDVANPGLAPKSEIGVEGVLLGIVGVVVFFVLIAGIKALQIFTMCLGDKAGPAAVLRSRARK